MSLIIWSVEHPLLLHSSLHHHPPTPPQDLSASSALSSQAVYLSPGRDPTRPGPLFVFLLWLGPPGAIQPGREIRIPYCCIADILSHHLLGFCQGRLQSETSCLHLSPSVQNVRERFLLCRLYCFISLHFSSKMTQTTRDNSTVHSL